jgi:hypothetical protein
MDGRRQTWAISCIGEPTAEIEDALTDEVPIALGRHVLRLACASSVGRRMNAVPAPEPNHAIRAVIDEAIVRGRPASRRSFRSTSADTGTATCRPTTPSWRAAFRRSSSRSGAGRRPDQPPGDPGPGIAPLRSDWIPDGDAEVRVGGAVLPSLAGCSHRCCCSARPHRRPPCGPRHFRRSRPLSVRLHERAPAPAAVDTS